MSEKQTYNIVPKLRFPEFREERGWEIKRLGEIAIRVTNRNKDNKPLPVLTNSATGGIVCQQDYFDREIVTKDNLINYSIVDVNDFVYNPRISTAAPVGPISRNNLCLGIMSPLYTVFRFTEGCLDYFEQYFKTGCWHQYLKGKANFGARFDRMNITLEDFLNMPIPFPVYAEQQRIAQSLLELDELIKANNEKLEQLKAHKKSLLQKLFPQNGKTVPEYRFPEFKQNGEWKRKSLKEVIKVNSGRDYKHLDAGNIPVYGTGGYMLSVSDKLSDCDAVGIGRKGTIDKPQYLKAPFWTVDTLFFLTAKNDYDTKFIYYLAQNIPWRKYGEQTGVPSLSKKSIENLEVIISENNAEQTKIAQIMSFLDKELSLFEMKKSLLEKHKSGLEQQLFPQNNGYGL